MKNEVLKDTIDHSQSNGDNMDKTTKKEKERIDKQNKIILQELNKDIHPVPIEGMDIFRRNKIVSIFFIILCFLFLICLFIMIK